MSKIGEKIIRDMRSIVEAEQRVRDLQKAHDTYEEKVKEMHDLLEEVGKILNSDPNDEGKEER